MSAKRFPRQHSLNPPASLAKKIQSPARSTSGHKIQTCNQRSSSDIRLSTSVHNYASSCPAWAKINLNRATLRTNVPRMREKSATTTFVWRTNRRPTLLLDAKTPSGARQVVRLCGLEKYSTAGFNDFNVVSDGQKPVVVGILMVQEIRSKQTTSNRNGILALELIASSRLQASKGRASSSPARR